MCAKKKPPSWVERNGPHRVFFFFFFFSSFLVLLFFLPGMVGAKTRPWVGCVVSNASFRRKNHGVFLGP